MPSSGSSIGCWPVRTMASGAAQHWLDVVRYAETEGYEYDRHLPDAWRYRDYVIDSFNRDKPFDRFVTEQIAGDETRPGRPRVPDGGRSFIGSARSAATPATRRSPSAATRC